MLRQLAMLLPAGTGATGLQTGSGLGRWRPQQGAAANTTEGHQNGVIKAGKASSAGGHPQHGQGLQQIGAAAGAGQCLEAQLARSFTTLSPSRGAWAKTSSGCTTAKPRGASLERYGFRFTQVGRHGQEAAWRVQQG
jgi:hypothetical protein